MTKQLILIDLDDTLWDTWANNKESLCEVYTALGWGRYFSSFEDYFETYYYPINHQLWERYNREDISKEELSYERLYRPIYNRYQELRDSALGAIVESSRSYWDDANDLFMERIRQKTGLCQGALELLRYLRSKHRVCILSNGFGDVQYDKIRLTGLDAYIDEVILSEDVGYNKPNPRIFEIALERMGVTIEQAMMIGDSWSSDIRGAAAVGMDSIWYNRYALAMPTEEGVKPLHIVEHLEDIKYIL